MIYCATDVSSVDVDLPIPEVSLYERTESRGESVKYYCLADAQKFIFTRLSTGYARFFSGLDVGYLSNK